MNATDVVDVVSDFVQLKRRGSNMQGLCPFHNEKTPSFSVSPSKQIYKCFGCGEAGNAVSFLMNLEKMSYVEAIRYLADKYKIELQETEMSDEQKESFREVESIGIVNNAAQAYFEDQLWNSEEGKNIGLSYFRERGLSDDTIKKWGLGYSPESRSAFYKWASDAGYNDDILLKAGLIGERDGRYYDKYSARVIFPIYSLVGKVLGFGARILDSTKKTAKYLNSPENELYHKSKILYGLSNNKKAIVEEKMALMTEGYMDVIGLSEHEIDTAVASSGTSLTADQVRLLKKYTDNIVMLYDSDAAGLKASMRAIDISLQEGMTIHLVQLKEGEDPDSFVKKYGKNALLDYIREHKKDFVDFTYDAYLSEHPDDIQARNETTNVLAKSLSYITRIEDITLRASYVRKAADRMGIDEKSMLNLVNKYQREEQRKPQRIPSTEQDREETPISYTAKKPVSPDHQNEKSLLALLLTNPEHMVEEDKNMLTWLKEMVEQNFVISTKVKKFINTYREMYDQNQQVNVEQLTRHRDPEIVDMTIEILHNSHAVSPNWGRYQISITEEDIIEKENFEKTILYFQLRMIKKMIKEELDALENETDIKKTQGIQQSITVLKTAEKELTQRYGTIILK